MKWWDWMPCSSFFECWVKLAFSLSFFTLIKRLFSSSLLYALRVVSSAYWVFLIFLKAIFIPSWASSSPTFCRMYSACKLNKQGDNMHSWHTLFPIWNQFVVPCLVVTVASCPALRFLKIVLHTSKMVLYSHHFKNFIQYLVTHTARWFSVVSGRDIFLQFTCFSYVPKDVGNLISFAYAFSQSILNIWKFLVQVLLKPVLENLQCYLGSMRNYPITIVISNQFLLILVCICFY